jgi:hypothetical protein
MTPARKVTTGDGPGPARNDDDRADRDWLRATVAQDAATRTLHSSMALWQPGDRFRAWCGVCGWMGPYDRDKPTVQAWAKEHEADSMSTEQQGGER